jgi:hypothetical protein
MTVPTASTGRSTAIGAIAVTARPLAAYRDMFLLNDDDLAAGPILDCPSGASPFGAQVRALGGHVVSVDPAYSAPDALVERARADLDRIRAWQRADPSGFDWSYLGSPDGVHRAWSDAIDEFAADFALDGERYLAAALPSLPFPERRFSTAVSGFLLFSYPEVLDLDDHRHALLELVRVTRGDVRVFPLHDTAGTLYPYLDRLRAELSDHGVATTLSASRCSYSPYPGSDRLLICRRRGPRAARDRIS